MKLVLPYCKSFGKGLKLVVLLLVISPVLVTAQVKAHKMRLPDMKPAKQIQAQPFIYPTLNANLRTAGTATCPTSPVGLAGQDTLGAAITNGQTFLCNPTPFYIYVPSVSGNIASPCIETEYTNFHTNMGTDGTETFYEGGVDIGCIGPSTSCAFPIGGGTALNNTQWGLILSLLDPAQAHEFTLCRTGTITTSTVTLIDCWTGNILPATPPSTIYSNGTTVSGGKCDTIKLAAGTDIGTAAYSISPPSGAVGFTDLHDGEAYVNTALLAAGTYVVTYSFTPPAADGCSMVTGTFTFTIGPNITVSVNSPTVCSGTDATLTATGSGGTAPYTYSWTPSTDLSATTGSPVTVINPTVTTVYTVTAMDGGCTSTATSTVTVNTTPTFSVNSIAICGGGANDTLTATGNATTYSWTPATGLSATSGSTVTATPTVTTIYTITGVNGTCSSTESATVTITSNPTVTVNSATVCTGGTATLTAGGATTYTWSPATGLSATTGAVVTANPTVTTTYTITGSAGSCTAIPGTSTVTVASSSSITVNSAAICIGGSGSATLTANGATTYSWTPAIGLSATTGSMVVASPTVTTTYTITGTTGACVSTDTSRVSLVPVPTFTVNNATMCSGQPAMLIGSNSTLTYTWSPAATTTVSATTDTAWVNPPSTTVYTITGANEGCSSLPVLDSVKVIASPTIAVLSPTVCVGTTATITATGATSYTWTPLTNLTHGVTNDTVYISTPTVSTTYTVTGTAANGCISSAVSHVDTSNHLGILSGTPISSCFGSYLQLAALGASTYTWTSNDPANLNFGGDTTWTVVASVANVGTYTVAIYGESHSGTYCNGRDTVIVTINPTPTITVVGSPTAAICVGGTTTLTVAQSGTVAITSYNWTPATGLSSTTGSMVTASPSVTTVYTATGTDASGCSSSVQYTVDVIPVPSFTVNSPTICVGGSDTLQVVPTTTVSGAGAYTWTLSTGLSATTGTAVVASPTVSTTYTVVGINAGSGIFCPSLATSTVTVNALPTITVTPSYSICAGGTATLTAGVTAISYTWNSTSTTYTAVSNFLIDNPASTSVYTVTGTSPVGSCTAAATTTVTVNPNPTFTISNNNPVFCIGGSSTLTAVSTSTAVAATYVWTPATGLSSTTGTSVTATPSVTIIYTVNATSTVGNCPSSSVSTITVNPLPNISITPTSTTVCDGSSTTLTASNGVTYTWSPVGSVSSSSLTTVSTTPTVTTTYTVIGKDANGCVDSSTAIVNINPIPTASASVNNPLCKGETINLTSNSVSGTPTYTWSCSSNGYNSNLSNPTIANSTTANNGTYTLTISAGGCTASNTVVVTVNNPPIVSVTPSTATICPNSTFTYMANGASTYTWSPATGLSTTSGSVVSASSATTTDYTVVGTNVAGCTALATFTLNVNPITANFIPTPDAGITPLNVVFTNSSVSGTATNTYSWNYGNGSNSVTTALIDTASTIYNTAGTYTVVLTAVNAVGCVSTATTVIVVTESYTITIPNIFTPNGDNINDNFVVKSEGVTAMSMEIFDRWGLKMFSSNTINAPWDGKTAAGKDVPDDTYFYIINATDNKGNNNKYKGDITLIR